MIFLSYMIIWFAANRLVLNIDKLIKKFITKNSHSTLHMSYKEKYLEGTVNKKISWFTNL